MIDYQNLRNSYMAAVQIGLLMNVSKEEAKRGNELLHNFCESIVDNSNYSEREKRQMKKDLNSVKETISHEIEHSSY